MQLFICQYCSTERKNNNSLKNHQVRCPSNLNRKYQNGMLGKKNCGIASNQFLKAKELGILVPTSKCKGRKTNLKPAPKSPEALIKLSNLAKERMLGGVRQSKRIKYKDKTLGSSYELELVKNLDENNIKWDTCGRFKYIDPIGKIRSYTPDIYLIDYDVYLDPKNDFLIDNINPSLGFSDKVKIDLVEKQNKIKVIILNKHQLDWNTLKMLL